MKSYGVTIQLKPLLQYFYMVQFVFQHFRKLNLGFILNVEFSYSWGLKGYIK